MKRKLLVIALFLITAFCQAQTGSVLTNKSVVALCKAGLDKTIIISTINNNESNFDKSATAILNLKKQGVPNDVIAAIVNKISAGKNTSLASVPAKTGTLFPATDMINYVYSYNKVNNKVVPLEKSVASMKTKYKLMGYGGASVVYNIEGEKSPVRIAQADSVYFVFNTGGAAVPEMSLYELTISKKSREAASQKVSVLKGNTGASNMISYTLSLLKPGVYQLIPIKKMKQGEYFFATKSTLTASSIDVFAFGVD